MKCTAKSFSVNRYFHLSNGYLQLLQSYATLVWILLQGSVNTALSRGSGEDGTKLTAAFRLCSHNKYELCRQPACDDDSSMATASDRFPSSWKTDSAVPDVHGTYSEMDVFVLTLLRKRLNDSAWHVLFLANTKSPDVSCWQTAKPTGGLWVTVA